MERKQRFSLRKYKFGLASVLLGTVMVFGGMQVRADEAASAVDPAVTTEQVTPPAEQEATTGTAEVPTPTEDTADKASTAETASTSQEESAQSSANVAPVTEKTPVTEVTPVAEKTSAPETTPVVEAKDAQEETLDPADQTAPIAEAAAETTANTPAAQEATQAEKVVAEPNSISSNEMISVPQTWETGYKGEGMVVAIIDSGLDVNHDAMRISDPAKARFKDEAAMEAKKAEVGITYGKWYNDKVVFAYDYMDGDDNIKEGKIDSHGMHVTGIATANPSKEDSSGEFVYGVAPEAQVIFMRVFSDRSDGTSDSIYVQAIRDAVKLGADVINMSIGSSTGSQVNAGKAITEAIAYAREHGVTVTISAGNSNTFGNGQSTPLAENPDYGVVGAPSVVRETLSIASVNNTVVTNEVMNVVGLESDKDLNYGKFLFTAADTQKFFEKGVNYEYVYAGRGNATDFDGLDLDGKVALIERGDITFTEKITNALQHDAIGVIVFNNQDGANITMSIEGAAKTVPAVFISKIFGQALLAGHYQLQFNGQMDIQPNPESGQMSDFTSWGVTTDGQLKPDVTAPGGAIYSTLNDNTYGSMDGTSMAAPHAAGVAALVKQYLKATYPDLSDQRISELVKALIMSTAKPHYNNQAKAYTSPRQQGAGIIDTAAAITEGLYLTGDDNYPSVTMGNVGDTFSFNVTVHNISDKDRTLRYIVNTGTDGVDKGHFTLLPRQLSEKLGQEITVKANGTETITVTVDASDFTEELLKQMPNGYFLEGFVRFVDPIDGGDVVSLPFIGFRGEFQNLPVVEEPVYNLVREGKDGFYYDVPKTNNVPSSADVTGLLTTSNEVLYSTGKTTTRSQLVLGTVEVETETAFEAQLLLDEDGQVHLAISPNDDGNQDEVIFQGVFYRNFNNLTAAVYAADDTDFMTPLWESSYSIDGRKNYYDGQSKNPKSYSFNNTYWDGKDSFGNAVADGLYKYVVRYYSAVPGADEQTLSFNLQIDTKKPVITTAYVITDTDGKKRLVLRKPKDVGEGGIRSETVFYLEKYTNKSGQETVTFDYYDPTGQVRTYENKVYLEANEDGTYTLPEAIDLTQTFYIVEDYAGNRDYIALSDLIGEKDQGRLSVQFVDADTGADLQDLFTYRVKDSDGNWINLDKGKEINFVPFGHYTVELSWWTEDDFTVIGSKVIELDLTEDNSFQTVQFTGREIVLEAVSVEFDQVPPKGTVVTLTDDNGVSYTLRQGVNKAVYGQDIPVGTYQLTVTLPEGYEVLEDVSILENNDAKNPTKLPFTIINKSALNEAVAAAEVSRVTATATFYNASADKQATYKAALAAAKVAQGQKLTQSEIDALVADLAAATAALDGQATDASQLADVMASYKAIKKTVRYINASASTKKDYDAAYTAAADLLVKLAKGQLPQAEVDKVLDNFKAAESKLNGKVTSFTALSKAVKADANFQKTSAKFFNASTAKKDTYVKAYKQAQAVLKNKNATQADVDKALKALTAAKKALNGKATSFTALKKLVSAEAKFQKTSAKYKYASKKVKAAYTVAYKKAKAVLAKKSATQAEVNKAMKDLNAAKKKLNGKAPKK